MHYSYNILFLEWGNLLSQETAEVNLLCVNDQRDANSYNQFLSHSFCMLYMFRTNLVVHHQEHGIIYCTDCTKLCNTVYYAGLLMMND